MTAARARTALIGRGVRVSHALSLAAALVVLAVVGESQTGLAVAGAGSLLLASGLARCSRGAVVLAGVSLFGAVVFVAATGGTRLETLTGAFAAVLAADFGTFALGIGRDADASVPTARIELLHAVGSIAVALVTGGVGYALFGLAPGQSALGATLLLFAAVVLAVFLRG